MSSGPVDGVMVSGTVGGDMVSGYSVGVTFANIATFTSPWPPEKGDMSSIGKYKNWYYSNNLFS